LRVCVSDLGSQIFCRRFRRRQRGKYLLRFQEIATKKPLGHRPLNTIVARRSSALLTAPSIAKKSFLAVYRTICSQFGAKFKAKKCQVSGNYVKKNGRPCPKGRQMISVQNMKMHISGCKVARADADMGTIATIDAHACFCSGCCCCCCLWSNTRRKRETAQSRGLSICSEVF